MKIKKLETFTKPYVSFVKVTDEENNTGYGQMSTYYAITARLFKTSELLGFRKSGYFEDIENFIMEKEHKFPGSYVLRAIAGLDTALWDMRGKLKTNLLYL